MEFRESAFVGTITAGITHEMKNVLAIIKESAGLMEDLLSLTNEQQFAHRERFMRVLSNIGHQVARGVDLSSRLNKFAHSSDSTAVQLDLNDLVEDVVFLCQRPARAKGLSVEAIRFKQPLLVVSDPLRLQMVLFGSIGFLMQLSGSGAKLTVAAEEGEDGDFAVRVSVQEGGPTGAEWELQAGSAAHLEDLEQAAGSICGRIALHDRPGFLTLLLRKAPPGSPVPSE
ncbi:MAG TPA: hypothetical protein VK463_01335 [Desulfomonilaceae bacterium]|nr:hypothetical protein [Desulfomonilaceae bacterium]